jgi:hypothetical protein
MLSSAHGLRLAKFADRHECPAKARSLDAGRGNNIYTREGVTPVAVSGKPFVNRFQLLVLPSARGLRTAKFRPFFWSANKPGFGLGSELVDSAV